jgi:hypothetical protein
MKFLAEGCGGYSTAVPSPGGSLLKSKLAVTVNAETPYNTPASWTIFPSTIVITERTFLISASGTAK